jgi:predicted nucleic acid-binding protein
VREARRRHRSASLGARVRGTRLSVFLDSSAVVKRYADEQGAAIVHDLVDLVVSGLARVEVPAAIWRKRRIGEIGDEDAATLVQSFESDWLGGAFAVVPAHDAVLADAARLCARRSLRTYDAVQLASALAARAVDPDLRIFACFDEHLSSAARAEGLATLP